MLKHLKTLQNVSVIIHIIFRELVCSLLKSLNLKIWQEYNKSNVVMRQHRYIYIYSCCLCILIVSPCILNVVYVLI